MDPRDVYETWAPPDGVWSPWVKPVLFAHLSASGTLPKVEVSDFAGDLQPPRSGGRAIVVDLPGFESIGLGLDLLRFGFRPVTLFNACPAPEFLGERTGEVVPTTLLLSALLQGTERLQSAGLPLDAPPAFLLDSDRLGIGLPIGLGRFDNRWVVFTTDFPSANVLALRGIVGVQVVHRGALNDDLIDVLRQWQRAGLELSHIDLQSGRSAPDALSLPQVWWAGLSRIARRLWVLMSLRRNPHGGYGGYVMESTSGGG